MSYLDTTHDVYKQAALTPDVGLCCTTNPIWELPGLKIPKIMQEMNYGCGSTVHPRDLSNNPNLPCGFKTRYISAMAAFKSSSLKILNKQF